MVYTMRDFRRDYIKEHLPKLTSEEIQDVLRVVPPEEILATLSAEEILATLSAEQLRAYLDRVTADRKSRSRQPRRKK
jgi:hypothetical protein